MSVLQSEQEVTRSATRRSFMRSASVGAVAAAGMSLLPESEAQGSYILFRSIRRGFKDIQKHENAHVAALVAALGPLARPKPTFINLSQRRLTDFLRLAQTFENVGCGAYTGAAPAIDSQQYVAAAGSIALIEGRHAGWLNGLVQSSITTNAFGDEQNFERALTVAEVEFFVSPFISSLNGGPPITYSPARSPENDIAVLNFALALEYLEAEFYNLNVPRFIR